MPHAGEGPVVDQLDSEIRSAWLKDAMERYYQAKAERDPGRAKEMEKIPEALSWLR